MNLVPVEQPIDVLGLARVPTEQAVIAEDPQVARACDLLVGRRRNVVGVGQAWDLALIEELDNVPSSQILQQVLQCRTFRLHLVQKRV